MSWMVVFVGQGPLTDEGFAQAHQSALDKFEAIHRLTEEIAPDRIELALTSDDEQLMAVRANGGVVQTVAFRSYINSPKNTANREALTQLSGRFRAVNSVRASGRTINARLVIGEDGSVSLGRACARTGGDNKDIASVANRIGFLGGNVRFSLTHSGDVVTGTATTVTTEQGAKRKECREYGRDNRGGQICTEWYTTSSTREVRLTARLRARRND